LRAGHPNDYEALFVDGVIWVWDRNRKGVIETVLASANPTPCFRRFAASFL
jgi:hypothetical protein